VFCWRTKGPILRAASFTNSIYHSHVTFSTLSIFPTTLLVVYIALCTLIIFVNRKYVSDMMHSNITIFVVYIICVVTFIFLTLEFHIFTIYSISNF